VHDLSLRYYGHVFDATGYGYAARGYLHALHAAGVQLSVVDLMKHGRQVPDDLVASFVGRDLEPDFHLFHGIPPQWARLAFPLRNAIGMTVWETDTMPVQWRNALSHVLEVWLPCDFNLAAFRRDLRTPLFKLPHAIIPRNGTGPIPAPDTFLGTGASDFVFYSVFEWQERKSPSEMLHAYLRAFPARQDTVLVLKTSPHAAAAAQQALEAARRRTPSSARVSIRAESWSESQMEALYARGDCYLSLHRGEGWGYPLFDAAVRGKPVVATGYAGPLEYLSAEFAQLVPYQMAPVRQRYQYYHPTMRWADPDVAGAIDRLRWVDEHREIARTRAGAAAERLREMYSSEHVGGLARDELMRILKRTNGPRFAGLRKAIAARTLGPPIPIPGDWYDAGYFEDGTKSNWHDGYHWKGFGGLFTETARFLTTTFRQAESYLDVGCAKGFLVRALREAGKECWGIDHSAWALERAEPTVRPFLTRATAEDLPAEHPVDLVLAFDLLSHLTEDQAESFLRRARGIARMGVVAVIRSFDSDAAAQLAADQDADADLSHILVRTHTWWHDLFLKAGWRQDGCHRTLQDLCNQHPLPRKMGWRLYVYAAP
jgi:2-polyprenyl-3-methyl-5-hydroxy-6-metoxy-1,4-benzoquinol methylase